MKLHEILNKRSLTEVMETWSQRNPDKVKAAKKRYAEKNKEAIRERKAQQYKENKEHHYALIKERKQRNKEWALEELGNKCVECGATERLEFDHITPNVGGKKVSQLYSNRKQLEEEVSKCVLRCVDCHKARTQKQTNLAWSILSYLPEEIREEWLETPPETLDEIRTELGKLPQ